MLTELVFIAESCVVQQRKSIQHPRYKLLVTWEEVDHHIYQIFWEKKKKAEKSNLLSHYLKPRNLVESNFGCIQ